MEICIIEKTRKHCRCKTVRQFNQQSLDFSKYLIHNTIRRLDCVIGY